MATVKMPGQKGKEARKMVDPGIRTQAEDVLNLRKQAKVFTDRADEIMKKEGLKEGFEKYFDELDDSETKLVFLGDDALNKQNVEVNKVVQTRTSINQERLVKRLLQNGVSAKMIEGAIEHATDITPVVSYRIKFEDS